MINNLIVDISTEIMDELSSPTSLSIASISYWVRSNIGNLNNLLGTEIDIDSSTLEFAPELTEEEKSIMKKLYYVYFSAKSIQSNLGSAAYDIISYRSDGAEIRRVDKNTTAKSYLTLREQYQNELDQLVNSYKLKKALPLSVEGDDNYGINIYPREAGYNRQGDSNI